MAELLSQARETSARIRVENIIHTDITVELMEILELYAELLLARAGLLDMRDKNIKEGNHSNTHNNTTDPSLDGTSSSSTGLEEAAASIIYAAPRLPRDVRELGIVRNMLIERFGKDFAVRANDNIDNIVPARVVDKLKVDPPSPKLVQAYLEEIARTYGVDWPPVKQTNDLNELAREIDDDDDDDDDDGNGGLREQPILAETETVVIGTPSTPAAKNVKPNKIDIDGIGTLQNATPPKSFAPGGVRSPVSVAPPAARSDNPSPKVRLPGGGEIGDGKPKQQPTTTTSTSTSSSTTVKAKGGPTAGSGGGAGGSVPGKVPTVDDLAKRFSALKR
ncbi:hypothetical protein ABEF95_002399 [Exophiala dermatitidis]